MANDENRGNVMLSRRFTENHGEIRHSTLLAMQHITTPATREEQDARKPGYRRQRWTSGWFKLDHGANHIDLELHRTLDFNIGFKHFLRSTIMYRDPVLYSIYNIYNLIY